MCDVLFKDPNYTWFLFICYIYHVPVIKKYLTDINVPIKIKKKIQKTYILLVYYMYVVILCLYFISTRIFSKNASVTKKKKKKKKKQLGHL